MTTHLIITGQLKARTAIHIGSGNSNDLTDALIRRNGAGEPIIPGTAIAGALRSLLTRLAPNLQIDSDSQAQTICNILCDDLEVRKQTCTCVVCQLLGNLNPKDEDDTNARASRLYVFDACLANQISEVLETSEISTTIRDGVGINRATRTAADTAKFDLEVLPRGTAFSLRLELRSYHPGDPIKDIDRELLAIALSEWQADRVWLGGRVARGLGGFKLENLKVIERDLNDKDQLMAFLRQDNPWDDETGDTDWLDKYLVEVRQRVKISIDDNPAITRRWICAEFTLKATGPFVVNDTTSSIISGFDHAPLTLGLDNWRTPILSGASLRGVIRSHAEKIARTLATLQVETKDEFLQRCPACDPLASRSGKDRPHLPLESCSSLLAPSERQEIEEGAEVDDKLCLACRLFGSTLYGSRLIVEDAVCLDEKPDYKILDLLAIDRFTGGGADGAKFDALVLWQPRFKARLYLENPQAWELGWLALALRDMACGWLHVGMGAAKGLGQVEIDREKSWKLQLGFLGGDSFGLTANSAPSGIYQVGECTPDVHGDWPEKVRDWVDAFNDEIEQHQTTRPTDLPDSYFDGVIDKLYPITQPSGGMV
jgi:CRISPR/Cas system CSM-associated protein Csm3 (group 7 of RAMP superfamily)